MQGLRGLSQGLKHVLARGYNAPFVSGFQHLVACEWGDERAGQATCLPRLSTFYSHRALHDLGSASISSLSDQGLVLASPHPPPQQRQHQQRDKHAAIRQPLVPLLPPVDHAQHRI